MNLFKKNTGLLILLIFILITSCGKTYQQDYKPKYKSDWNNVEKYIHKNFHTSVIDSVKRSWIKGNGLVVPYTHLGLGGNNPTFFYWDQYFVNKGLLLIDSLSEFAKNGTDNLLWEVDTLGFVPNANRNWGMNRSQTPYLAMMVQDVYENMDVKDTEWLKNAYYALKKEYHFWTDTSPDAIENHNTSVNGLQRFYHHASKEVLFELYNQIYNRKLVLLSPDSISDEEKIKIAGHYAAEAETGWDFTTRFEHRCADFIAIDLNSNLYKYEEIFAWIVDELHLTNEPEWTKISNQRKDLINKYCWNEKEGLFMDYDFVNKRFHTARSAVSMYPLFVGLATQEQAERTREKLSLFEYDYGITACENTNQDILYQWDYPAGWSAIQLLTIIGLNNYGFDKDAIRISSKYLDLVTKNYLDPIPKTYRSHKNNTIRERKKGFIYEKYDAVSGQINDTEYPAGVFLSWSASVYIWCLDYINENK